MTSIIPSQLLHEPNGTGRNMGNPFRCLAFCTEQAQPDLPATGNKALLQMLLPDGELVLRHKIENHSQQVDTGVK